MKKIISIALIIVAVLLVLPALFGLYVRYDIHKQVNSKNIPENVQVKLLSYHEGWFTSDAVIQIQEKGMPSQAITVNTHITHGPIISYTNFDNQKLWSAGLAGLNSDVKMPEGSLKLYGTLTIWGNSKIHFLSENFQQTANQDKVKIKQGQTQGVIDVMRHGAAITGNINSSGLNVMVPGVQVQTPRMEYNFKMAKDENGYWIGYKELIIPSLNIRFLSHKDLHFNKVMFEARTQMDNLHDIVMNFSTTFNSLTHGQSRVYGPGKMQIEVTGMDAKKFEEIQNLLQDIAKAQNDQAARVQLLNNLFTKYLSALQGLQIQLKKFSFVTPYGNVLMHGKMMIPDNQTAQQQNPVQFALAMTSLLLNSSANLYFTAPKALIYEMISKEPTRKQAFAQWIQNLQAANILQLKGNHYQLNFRFVNGKAFVNNTPVTKAVTEFKRLQSQTQQPVTDTISPPMELN